MASLLSPAPDEEEDGESQMTHLIVMPTCLLKIMPLIVSQVTTVKFQIVRGKIGLGSISSNCFYETKSTGLW